MNKYIDGTSLAIIGVVVIAVVSVYLLQIDAKEIALAIGSGLVGYIAKGKED